MGDNGFFKRTGEKALYDVLKYAVQKMWPVVLGGGALSAILLRIFYDFWPLVILYGFTVALVLLICLVHYRDYEHGKDRNGASTVPAPIGNSPQIEPASETQKPSEIINGFMAAPKIDDFEKASQAWVNFTRIGEPVRDVTAKIIFENTTGYEVGDLPFGKWLGSKNNAVDFGTDEKRTLNIAVKDNNKPKLRAVGRGDGSVELDFEVEAIDLKVRVLLQFADGPESRTEEHIFLLQSDRDGRLRLLRQAKLRPIPNS